MTKKHFEALAKALRVVRLHHAHQDPVVWNECVEAVAAVCKEFNINFNFTEFFKACGRFE